jgi:hypothetical protein
MATHIASAVEVMRSRANVALMVSWVVLGVVLGLAVAQGASFAGGLTLVGVAFFVLTALLGSRLWLALSDAHAKPTPNE